MTQLIRSAIFRITGTCYFWQFSIFDGDESGVVFTDSSDFSVTNRSKPTFSHHKLTCFEYADGVNIDDRFNLTDLGIYYSKLSNAFNKTARFIDTKIDSRQAQQVSHHKDLNLKLLVHLEQIQLILHQSNLVTEQLQLQLLQLLQQQIIH